MSGWIIFAFSLGLGWVLRGSWDARQRRMNPTTGRQVPTSGSLACGGSVDASVEGLRLTIETAGARLERLRETAGRKDSEAETTKSDRVATRGSVKPVTKPRLRGDGRQVTARYRVNRHDPPRTGDEAEDEPPRAATAVIHLASCVCSPAFGNWREFDTFGQAVEWAGPHARLCDKCNP